jgi:hypothetical protein
MDDYRRDLSSRQDAWNQATSVLSQAAAQAPSEQEAAATLAFLSGYVNQHSRPVGLAALCWARALDNQPSLALPYCDRAIQQKASPAAFDGRALARASQGHWPGTVEDLQAFLNRPTGQAFADRGALETIHRAWLAAARVGQNPFDDTARARLRKE